MSSVINSKISLADAGVALTISDTDTLDEEEMALKVSMDVRGGVASYDQETSADSTQNYHPEYVTITGGKITIAHDGLTPLSSGVDWISY